MRVSLHLLCRVARVDVIRIARHLPVFLVLGMALSIGAFAQADTTSHRADSALSSESGRVVVPSFRSIQIDATTILRAGVVGGSGDLDVVRVAGGAGFGIGVRPGFELGGSFGGISGTGHPTSSGGSGVLIYNLLGRVTMAPEPFRLDLFLGAAAERTSLSDTTDLLWEPKLGIEFRWMFVEHYVGLLLKYSATIPADDRWNPRYPTKILGIGVVVGYQP